MRIDMDNMVRIKYIYEYEYFLMNKMTRKYLTFQNPDGCRGQKILNKCSQPQFLFNNNVTIIL